MVSINIRVSTQEIWRYRKQKLGSSYSPHSFIYRGCLGWILPDCVLCSHKDRGGGERESPLPSKMVSHSTHGAAVCFFHTTSKTFPRSAHMFVVLFFFSLFSHLFFNWRKIALQCCIGFCWTIMQISHNYTHIPSLSGLSASPQSHPLGHHRAPAWAPCVI